MLVAECHFCLQSDLLVFRSVAPLPEVHRLLHQTPSSHLPFVDSHPDPAELDDLSGEDSDEGATLAEDVKDKAVESLDRRRALSPKPALVVLRSRGQLCGRGGLVVMLGNSSRCFWSFSELAI